MFKKSLKYKVYSVITLQWQVRKRASKIAYIWGKQLSFDIMQGSEYVGGGEWSKNGHWREKRFPEIKKIQLALLCYLSERWGLYGEMEQDFCPNLIQPFYWKCWQNEPHRRKLEAYSIISQPWPKWTIPFSGNGSYLGIPGGGTPLGCVEWGLGVESCRQTRIYAQ